MTPVTDSTADDIAARFVEARRAARVLASFPGTVPATLAAAYAVQDAGIRRWPDAVAGWKVGRIPEEHAALGADRLIGPIFAAAIWPAGPAATAIPIFKGGFAAVEAEYVAMLGSDAPAGKTDFTPDEAEALVDEMRLGLETAGSPLAAINDLGPTVVISDFGNNAGLILGAAIHDWRGRPLETLTCRVTIDGRPVGRGGAASLPGGPMAALAFALNLAARRGMALKRGQLVSTGATTGIHDIAVGERARVDFDGIGAIDCMAVSARPAQGMN